MLSRCQDAWMPPSQAAQSTVAAPPILYFFVLAYPATIVYHRSVLPGSSLLQGRLERARVIQRPQASCLPCRRTFYVDDDGREAYYTTSGFHFSKSNEITAQVVIHFFLTFWRSGKFRDFPFLQKTSKPTYLNGPVKMHISQHLKTAKPFMRWPTTT